MRCLYLRSGHWRTNCECSGESGHPLHWATVHAGLNAGKNFFPPWQSLGCDCYVTTYQSRSKVSASALYAMTGFRSGTLFREHQWTAGLARIIHEGLIFRVNVAKQVGRSSEKA